MARRDVLKSLRIRDCDHPGLAWNRLLGGHEPENGNNPYHGHVRLVANVQTYPELYRAAFARWSEAMSAWPHTSRCRATTLSPTAIGLGTTCLVDIGITLHHTYGVPYLPGSALKGLARRAAADYDLTDEQVSVLFGDDNASAGYVTFWDGWLDPDATGVLKPDVITVHHPKYYATGGDLPPTDFDDPNPVAFLSVAPGVEFRVAVSAPDAPEWLPHAVEILAHGLRTLGIGAKTAVGYGTLDLLVAGDEADLWP